MLRILKLIYRFDHEASYDMIDKPGSVMRFLAEAPGGYWADIGENRNTRNIVGEHKDPAKAFYGAIHFEPTCFSGHFEHGAGVAFDSSHINKYLEAVGYCATHVLNFFKISNFTRAGSRFQIMSGTTDAKLDPSGAMTALFARGSDKMPSTFIRDTTDFSVTLEGTMESAVHYRVTTGPGAPADYEKFITGNRVVSAPPAEPTRHELALDIDLFERSIQIPGPRIQKWITTKYDIAERLLPDLRAMVLRR